MKTFLGVGVLSPSPTKTSTTSSQPRKRLVTSGIMISTRKLGDCDSGASRHDWFFSVRYANEINARTAVSKLSEVLGLVAGDHAKFLLQCDLLFSPSVCPSVGTGRGVHAFAGRPPGGAASGNRKDTCGPSRRSAGSRGPGTGGEYPRTTSSSGRRWYGDRPQWAHSPSPPYDFRCGWHEAAQARYGGNPRVKLGHRSAGLSRFCRLTTARKSFFFLTLPPRPRAQTT